MMCGVIGFAGYQPDIQLLERLAYEAGTRGPHSHGWYWIDRDGPHTEYGPGPLGEIPDAFQSGPPHLVLAHSRLATSGPAAGTRPDPDDGQPVLGGHGLALVHNGTVPGAPTEQLDTRQLFDTIGEQLEARATFTAAVEHAVREHCPGPTVVLAAWRCSLLAIRSRGDGPRAHPLYAYRHDRGTYLSSRPLIATDPLLPEGVTHAT